MTTEPVRSPVCPGSGTFPDVVEDTVWNERFYICSKCSAILPNFELAPPHEPGGHPVSL